MTLRIHPAIGVARAGNSDQFFVGPEAPGVPGNWDQISGKLRLSRDANGNVLRQAARFRIFAFDEGGNPTGEITLQQGQKIEWRVHVANKKASFFTFNGQSGAETSPPYEGRVPPNRPVDAIEKPDKGRGQPERKNLRNATVTDRRGLEIDPGDVRISAPGSADLIDSVTSAPIKNLGQIRMESTGHLLFLGGKGASASSDNPPKPIDEYASNDGWFDDMCDGSVHASVTFADGHVENAEPAWVITGPPKFAPEIRNVVSLYDTLWDLAVRLRQPCLPGVDPVLNDLVAQQTAWRSASNDLDPSYQPSFTDHIYPILSRALAALDVHDDPRRGAHGQLADWARLADPANADFRRSIFRRMRNPNAATLDRGGMPRGLGDDYTTLDDFENNGGPEPLPTAFLSLSRVQYALLAAWNAGRFRSDWTGGDVAYLPVPTNPQITPHGLDKAALENCVGGPFYPGIEVSWLVRQPSLYSGAFRLRDPDTTLTLGPLTFGAGFFSQQMALPWHADFYDCQKEDHTTDTDEEPIIYMWWTAQRPDDVRPDADSPFRRWVEPFDAAKEPGAPNPDDVSNLARFEQMRTRWHELSFVVLDGDDFVEHK